MIFDIEPVWVASAEYLVVFRAACVRMSRTNSVWADQIAEIDQIFVDRHDPALRARHEEGWKNRYKRCQWVPSWYALPEDVPPEKKIPILFSPEGGKTTQETHSE